MQVYHRPENSILVTVEQNACLRFGSSPAPAYLLTISALPSLIAPITNLRNTILIQQGLKDLLWIPPNRGVIRFNSIQEENFATNDATVMGQIEQLEQSARDGNPGILKSISRSMSRKLKSSSTNSGQLSLTTTAVSSVPLIEERHEPLCRLELLPKGIQEILEVKVEPNNRLLRSRKACKDLFPAGFLSLVPWEMPHSLVLVLPLPM